MKRPTVVAYERDQTDRQPVRKVAGACVMVRVRQFCDFAQDIKAERCVYEGELGRPTTCGVPLCKHECCVTGCG